MNFAHTVTGSFAMNTICLVASALTGSGGKSPIIGIDFAPA